MRKMQWDCAKAGCFNEEHRLDFSYFKPALPGRISFTDIDGVLEINGYFLFLEMKSHQNDLPRGQQICFEQLTKESDKKVVVFLCGKAKGMRITLMRHLYNGVYSDWEPCDLNGVIQFIEEFCQWAKNNGHDTENLGSP
jgi:hypothetical protein